MKFQWIGGPTFLAELGSFRLLSDPVFGEGPAAFTMKNHPSTGEDQAGIARLANLPDLNLEGINAVVFSHLHTDHFDPAARERLDKNLHVIAPAELLEALREWGFTNLTGLAWWQSIDLVKGGEELHILSIPARHALDDPLNEEMGAVSGYVFAYQRGQLEYRIYWTGDTVWFDDLPEIRKLIGRVDLLVPHLGAVGADGPRGRLTLDADEALRFVELFRPGRVIPIHHHTFSHYVEPVGVLEEKMSAAGLGQILCILEEGETVDLGEPCQEIQRPEG